jgi:drug/metabolite transporter (DMT)-like permease
MDGRALFFTTAVALLMVAANVFTERSLQPGKGYLMALVFLAACLGFWGFRYCCQAFGLTVASSVVDTLLTLLTVGYGVFILQEKLGTVQYAGIALLLVGLFLVKGPFGGKEPSKEPLPQQEVVSKG